jgi:hypothetical protein
MTQPKKRPLADPTKPPSVSRTSSSMTSFGSVPTSGSGRESRDRNSLMGAFAPIGRDDRLSR